MTEDKARNLYQRWGGIVRFVLAKAHDEYTQRLLTEAANKCETKDIMSYHGTESAPDHISHKLMHLIIDEVWLSIFLFTCSYNCHKTAEKQETSTSTTSTTAPTAKINTARYQTYRIEVASDYVAQLLAGKSDFWICIILMC